MKSVVLILAACALATAIPTPRELHFRNLYKRPVGDIKNKPLPRIIGGQEATPHSIPYQAFLEVYTENEAWYCGASLISQNYVLTAAHCGEDAVIALVTLGAHKIEEEEDTQIQVTSTEITIHAEYTEEYIINDIGVIKLPEPIDFTEAIQAVTLATNISNDNSGDTARVSGWGLTDGQGNTLSGVLNYVDVQVITNFECGSTFGSAPYTVICTSGNDGTGSCNGDSGGPLAKDGVLIGVVSFGIENCEPGYPSGYTRVSRFTDWISNNTDVQFA